MKLTLYYTVQSLGRPNEHSSGSLVCMDFGDKFNGSLGIFKFDYGLHVFPSWLPGFHWTLFCFIGKQSTTLCDSSPIHLDSLSFGKWTDKSSFRGRSWLCRSLPTLFPLPQHLDGRKCKKCWGCCTECRSSTVTCRQGLHPIHSCVFSICWIIVFQVATFIFIELVTFPLGCGVVLDLCTVWLFPEANMQSRAAFFVQAPLTAMFYHWVAGTMFMLVSSVIFYIALTHCSLLSLKVFLRGTFIRLPKCYSPRCYVVHQGSPGPKLSSHSRYSWSSNVYTTTKDLY